VCRDCSATRRASRSVTVGLVLIIASSRYPVLPVCATFPFPPRAGGSRTCEPSTCLRVHPVVGGGAGAGSAAAAAVARVLLGHPLVAAPVVAGQPRHQLLRVLSLHAGEELCGPLPAQRGGVPAVMGDVHGAAAVLVVEPV